jgi:chemotaxis protein CheD
MAGVRMGEMAVSATASDELIALGLGSCIGLAIVDRAAGVAGLAHVVLPESHGATGQPGRFADTAVPELLARLRRAGAADRRMEVALVGGARMFEMSGGRDIGARNEQAVRTALDAARLTPRATQTGGNQGRTVKVSVGAGTISVRVAGLPSVTLVDGAVAAVPRGASRPAAHSPARGHTAGRSVTRPGSARRRTSRRVVGGLS